MDVKELAGKLKRGDASVLAAVVASNGGGIDSALDPGEWAPVSFAQRRRLTNLGLIRFKPNAPMQQAGFVIHTPLAGAMLAHLKTQVSA